MPKTVQLSTGKIQPNADITNNIECVSLRCEFADPQRQGLKLNSLLGSVDPLLGSVGELSRDKL